MYKDRVGGEKVPGQCLVHRWQDMEPRSIGDGMLSPGTKLGNYSSKDQSPSAPALAKDLALSWMDAKRREMDGDSPSKMHLLHWRQMDHAVSVARVASPLR